ncbi:hypothetical protein GQ53DRAFT_821252 [Thozetella sp. PMI_491]|nr:hypothetical protein GQ53DRAFT_821252 [Thozetella sp. PMI_491]
MDTILSPFRSTRPIYSSVESQSDADSESGLLNEKEEPRENKIRDIHVIIPWILAVTFAVIAMMLWVQPRPHNSQGTYEMGFETDFKTVIPEIRVKQVQFTGGLRDAHNGTLMPTESTIYSAVGHPSTEIDAAWTVLTHGIDLYATKEESRIIGDGMMHQFADTGVYKMGIEWLHSLHCLNYIRKALDADYYDKDLHHPLQGHHTHLDHCIDALRQTIQCHGDITPLPKYVDEETGHEFTDFHQYHTCRDFDMLREWANTRGYDALVEANKQKNNQ